MKKSLCFILVIQLLVSFVGCDTQLNKTEYSNAILDPNIVYENLISTEDPATTIEKPSKKSWFPPPIETSRVDFEALDEESGEEIQPITIEGTFKQISFKNFDTPEDFSKNKGLDSVEIGPRFPVIGGKMYEFKSDGNRLLGRSLNLSTYEGSGYGLIYEFGSEEIQDHYYWKHGITIVTDLAAYRLDDSFSLMERFAFPENLLLLKPSDVVADFEQQQLAFSLNDGLYFMDVAKEEEKTETWKVCIDGVEYDAFVIDYSMCNYDKMISVFTINETQKKAAADYSQTGKLPKHVSVNLPESNTKENRILANISYASNGNYGLHNDPENIWKYIDQASFSFITKSKTLEELNLKLIEYEMTPIHLEEAN